jgi:hypothetical protein
MKSVTLLNNMTYIQNKHGFRAFKLSFAKWLKFCVIEELTYEIDVWLQEKILTNDALTWFEAVPSRTQWFGWVIFAKQLHFHILYLFVALGIKIQIFNRIVALCEII